MNSHSGVKAWQGLNKAKPDQTPVWNVRCTRSLTFSTEAMNNWLKLRREDKHFIIVSWPCSSGSHIPSNIWAVQSVREDELERMKLIKMWYAKLHKHTTKRYKQNKTNKKGSKIISDAYKILIEIWKWTVQYISVKIREVYWIHE